MRGRTVAYLKRDKSGRLEFRRAFPEALRPFVPGNRRELTRSLGATSIHAPDAIERYRAAMKEFDKTVTAARKASSGAFDALDAPTIAYLAESFHVQALDSDDAGRWAKGDEWEERWPQKTRETLEGMMPVYRHFQATGDLDGILHMWTDEALEFSASHGYRVNALGESFVDLCRALNEAAIRAGEARLQRLDGSLVPTPKEPPKPANQTPVQSAPRLSIRTLTTLALEELDRPTATTGESTAQAARTALRLFSELHGDRPPEEISRAMVTQFIDALARCPVVRGKARRPLPELVEAFAGEDVPRLSWKTRDTHVGSLQAIWTKLQVSGQIDAGHPNPFAKHNLGKRPQRRENEGFEPHEIEAIFSLGVFTRGDRPRGGKGEACFWLPLLLATSGARPEEIAQLMVGDIRNEGGRWLLTITGDGIHPHKGPRRLKNTASERTFPLPGLVLDLGFLDYLDWLKVGGEVALFPALRLKSKRELLYQGFGDWWGRYLRQHSAYPKGRRAGRDFRHTWATIARTSGVRDDALEYIMGHSPAAKMNARYGTRRPLGDEMANVSFAGWGMEPVRPWAAPL